MSNGVVEFDIGEFRKIHPELSTITDDQLRNFFKMACIILDNTPSSFVQDLEEREILLNLLVCHLATLSARGGSTVGLMASATQSKVSVSFSNPQNQTWYNQTQCGYTFYMMIRKYILGGRYYAYNHCQH